MALTFSNSLISATDRHLRSISGGSLKPSEQQYLVSFGLRNLSLCLIRPRRLDSTTYKRGLAVQAGYSDSGRPSSTSIFMGGFLLGGIIAGTLGCVYAPQISRALAGTDKKDLMRKLPKFIYDEEKALEKTRKVLAEKIAQLNSAIDDVSSQLRADDGLNRAAAADEVEAAT